MQGSLLLVGCGKMGGAMLNSWLERGLDAAQVHVVEPNADAAAQLSSRGVNVVNGHAALPTDLKPEVVIMAVKPQVMDAVIPPYASFSATGTVFLSIAAGKTIGYFENSLGSDAAIIRAMPNTPAAVGRGITVACGNNHVTDDQKNVCLDLLGAVGDAEWVDDEGLIDAVTALSGGGPAYVFLLAQCMTKAGIASGLPPDLSEKLARATVAGSGELLRQSTEPASTLRENVTSPGGTTEEALRVLMADDAWQSLMDRAIAAATARSKELAG